MHFVSEIGHQIERFGKLMFWKQSNVSLKPDLFPVTGIDYFFNH